MKNIKQVPELKSFGIPIWWHQHGTKLGVKSFDQQNFILVLGSDTATVVITKGSSLFPKAEGWFVDYKIIQFAPSKEGTHGRVWFSDKNFKVAFGFSDDSGTFGNRIIEQFGADVADQGKYIRWKNYLNIPCPGTGGNGDPNISVYLSDDIKNNVKKLLEDALLLES